MFAAKQQLLLQLWREMQACGVLWKLVLSLALTVLATAVEKNAVCLQWLVGTHKHTKETTTEDMVVLLIWLVRVGKEEENGVTKYTLNATYSFAQR